MRVRYFLVFAVLSIASPAMADSWANNSSHYCLDTDGTAVNGGQVRMWKCAEHDNQRWNMVFNVAFGGVRLVNRSSHFCLDTDGSKTNGGRVRMWGCANHPNQYWQLQKLPENNFRLKNKASGFCLDTDGAAVNGGAVRMWTCATHPHQSWKRLVPIDDPSEAAASRIDPPGATGGSAFEGAFPDRSVPIGLRVEAGAMRGAPTPHNPGSQSRSEHVEVNDPVNAIHRSTVHGNTRASPAFVSCRRPLHPWGLQRGDQFDRHVER
jgi:hypothetical protein